MQRRGFFGALAGIVAGGSVTPTLKAERGPEPLDAFRLGVWKFRWKGWHESPDADRLYGVWTAHRIDVVEQHLYSCTGGHGGATHVGCVYNIGVTSRQEWLTADSPPEVRAQARRQALTRLLSATGRCVVAQDQFGPVLQVENW